MSRMGTKSTFYIPLAQPLWMNKGKRKPSLVNIAEFLLVRKVEGQVREKERAESILNPGQSRLKSKARELFFDPVDRLSVVGQQSTMPSLPKPLPISVRPKVLRLSNKDIPKSNTSKISSHKKLISDPLGSKLLKTVTPLPNSRIVSVSKTGSQIPMLEDQSSEAPDFNAPVPKIIYKVFKG